MSNGLKNRPELAHCCPFISERSLRNAKSPTILNISSDVLKRNYQDNLEINGKILCGMFSLGKGLVRASPVSCVGLQVFFYNKEFPPDFNDGFYQKFEVVKNSTNVPTSTVNDKITCSVLQPPPLPSWTSGVVKNIEPKKIVITRNMKVKSETPVASGWQAIMAEMNFRKEGMLRKTDIVPEKPTLTKGPKLNTTKKKGKGFKDIMEELSYKLAKLRGEIVDSDTENDTSAQGKVIEESFPRTDSKETINGTLSPENVTSATPPSQSGLRKLVSRPNLNNMLAKVKPPLEGNAIEVSSEENAPPVSATIKANVIPLPPIVPTCWPPVSVINDLTVVSLTEVPINKVVESIESISDCSYRATQGDYCSTVSARLEHGYYMPEIVLHSVMKGQVVCGGTLTSELLESLMQHYLGIVCGAGDDEGTVNRTALDVVNNGNDEHGHGCYNVKAKLTVGDLPLPSDFQTAVDRMRNANKIRAERLLNARELDLRYYSSSKKDFPCCLNSHTKQRNMSTGSKNHSFRLHLQPPRKNNNQCLSTTINIDLSATEWIKSLRCTDVPDKVVNSSVAYESKFKELTLAKEPKFQSVVNRRSSSVIAQNVEEALKQEHKLKEFKTSKEFLKVTALKVAKDAGVYRPANRNYHQKLCGKYGISLDS